nr:MAG TPA: minor capsid protein [Caudoviricetes sp.]
MFTPTEIEALPSAMEQLYRSLQLNIMSDLTERLKANGEEITSAVDWQINRLYELGVSKDEIDSLIQSTLDVSDDEIDRIYDEVVKSGYARNEELYTSKGKEHIPYAENKQLQQLVKAVKNQTKTEYRNITGSLGFAVRNPDNTVSFTPLAKFYQDTLDNGLMQIASGAFDYNTVLKRVVKTMTDSGLRSVEYSSGWSNRVDVAARRALMTGFNQVVAKVNEDNAEQLGTEYFEVSYHRGARPTHQVWQGRVYSKKELETVCGLGTVTGLCGANCYHSYSPFIKGIDTPTYSEEELDRMNEEENTPKEYNGKTYTAYEAQQRQRQLETAMRADRQKIELLTQGGADDDTITGAKVRYFQRQDEYVKFSKAMNLPQQWERITVDGKNALGSKLPKKAESVNKITAESVAKSGKSGIIKEKSKKPITPITDKAISRIPKVDIEGYTEEQCLEIQKQHKELLKFSKEQNDNKEVAFVLKNDVSKMITEPIKGTDEKIDFGSALQGKDLFVMHNHPRNSSYSLNDIIEFIKNDSIKTFTIVKNDGNIEVLTKLEGYDRLSLLTELQRMGKKKIKTGSDSEYRKVIDKFLSKHQEGGLFEWKK